MFVTEIRTEATPERVFELIKIVKDKSMNESEVRERLEPAALNKDSSSYFNIIKKAAEELELIKITKTENDSFIELNINKPELSDLAEFRKYCNKKIFSNTSWIFYKFTKCVLNSNDNWLQYDSVSSTSVLNYIKNNTDFEKVPKETVLGGRFWLSFLGFVYVFENRNSIVFLPNMYAALKDFISMADLNTETDYTVSEFIDKIKKYASVALDGTDKRQFNMAFSNALRQMYDLGEIVLERRLDSKEVWNMFNDNQHEFVSEITHIRIKGLINE